MQALYDAVAGGIGTLAQRLIAGSGASTSAAQQPERVNKWFVRSLPRGLQQQPSSPQEHARTAAPAKRSSHKPPTPPVSARGRERQPSAHAKAAAAEEEQGASPAPAGASTPVSPTRKRAASSSPAPRSPGAKYKGPNGAPSPAYRGRGGTANDDGSYWRK